MKYIVIILAAMIAPCYYTLFIKNSKKVDETIEDVYHEAECYSYVKSDSYVYKDTIKVQFKNGILYIESSNRVASVRGKTLAIKDKNSFPVIIDSISYRSEARLTDIEKESEFTHPLDTWRINGLSNEFWQKNFNKHMLEFRGDYRFYLDHAYGNISTSTYGKRIYCKEKI